MIVTNEIHVFGMHCNGCEKIIEDALKNIDGVLSIKADYLKAIIKVSFDSNRTNLFSINEVCISKGYKLELLSKDKKQNIIKITLSIFALLGLFMLILIARKLGHQLSLPEVNSKTSEGMIFLVGLLTGLHCVGMCGSFIIGYTTKDAELGRSVFRSHIFYGVGKTLSYVLFGALFGLLGSLFRITPIISGISITLAGAFLFLYGLNMLNIFSVLKFIRIKQSKVLTNFTMRISKHSGNPFIIGIFAGFLFGCGPLQVMYIMAAGNGNILEGAKFLLLFGLGTLPALFGFGLITRLLSNKMTRHFIHISGIILIFMGSMMFSKGLMRAKSGDEIKPLQSKCHCVK